MHMAIGAVVNAVWDPAARHAGRPLWRRLAEAGPEERTAHLPARGHPACTASAGRLRCADDKLTRLADFVVLSGTDEDRMIEYVDHVHEHFLDPVVMREGHCTAPAEPGFSAAMRPESIAEYTFPGGTFRAADLEGKKGQAA